MVMSKWWKGWRWPQRGERVKAGILYTLVTIVVAAALVLSALRLAAALAPSLVTTVESRVSAALGVPVRMAGFDARIDGLRPSIILDTVKIGDDGQTALSLESLSVAIAPWRSLQAGALRLHALSVTGLDVEVARLETGQWQTSGLLSAVAPTRNGGLVQSLRALPVDRLLISDSTLRLRDALSGERWQLQPVALRWQRKDSGEWRFALDARDGEQRVRGRVQLDANQIDQARGYVDFANWRGNSLAPLLAQAMPQAPSLPAQSRLDGQMWLQMGATGIEQVSANLSAEQLDGFHGLNALQADLWLSRDATGWAGVIEPTAVGTAPGRRYALSPIGFGRASDTSAPWRARLQDLPLALMADLALMNDAAFDQVSGQFETLDVVWQSNQQWQARAQLRDFDLPASRSWPALSGPSAELALGPRGGQLTTQNWQAGIPERDLLRAPIDLTHLNATLSWWQPSNGGLRLSAPRISAQWLGSAVNASGQFWRRPEQTDWVDIQADYAGATTAAVLGHLPVGIMHPNLPGWLDRAIEGGSLSAASLRLFGPLADFPFDQGRGLFDLRTAIDGVDFRFNPQWGGFSDADAQLRFRNRGMRIDVAGADIGGLALTSAQARIDDLWAPELRVEGQFSGELEQMQAYLQATPLPAAKGLNALRMAGEGALDLAVFFPFQQRPPQVSGALQVNGAEFALDALDQPFEAVRGVINFDQAGLNSQGLRAQFAGVPVIAQATTQGQGDAARIRVDATATLDVTRLPALSGLASVAEGPAQWRAVWERPGWMPRESAQSRQSSLTLRSDLAGTALSLPLGLSKDASVTRDTQIRWAWGADQSQDVRLAYGDQLHAHGRWPADGQGRLGVNFGADPAVLPTQAVTQISGTLPVVALDGLTGDQNPVESSWAQRLPPLAGLDVELAGIDVARWRIPATQVRAEVVDEIWRLRLDGAAAGQGQWRGSSPQQLTLDLTRLVVDRRPDLAEPEAQASATQPSTPTPASQRPRIDLQADTLVAAGSTLGQLDFSLSGGDSQAEQAEIRILGDQLDLNVVAQPVSQTAEAKQLRFDLFTDDAGALLRGFGLPRAMRDGMGEASGELTWVGPLLSPALESLDGEVSVDFRKGALLAIEPGPGRALGLFSLSVLPRRIGLDFSDVVGEGLSFDSLTGSWAIDAGVMQTDDLTLDGPSLNLDVVGQTDLVRRRYDQDVTVTPRLSSALSFLGGLAGGPVAAVVLFFSRDIIEPGVERLTELEYRIVGPWSDPRFELLTPLNTNNDTRDSDND